MLTTLFVYTILLNLFIFYLLNIYTRQSQQTSINHARQFPHTHTRARTHTFAHTLSHTRHIIRIVFSIAPITTDYVCICI